MHFILFASLASSLVAAIETDNTAPEPKRFFDIKPAFRPLELLSNIKPKPAPKLLDFVYVPNFNAALPKGVMTEDENTETDD